jgi:hypothetical protein
VDPGTEPTSTMYTSTHATRTQPTSTQTTSTPPTGMSKEDWEKLDRRARSTIRLCLTDSVLLNVSRESTANELWDKLGNLYQSKSLENKQFLRKYFYHLKILISVSTSWGSAHSKTCQEPNICKQVG